MTIFVGAGSALYLSWMQYPQKSPNQPKGSVRNFSQLQVAPPQILSAYDGPLRGIFDQARTLRISERVNVWSEYLARAGDQGISDLKGLVSQRPEIADSAPIIPSRFDCTTFIETVSALSQSSQPEEFYSNLIKIRYEEAIPTYNRRNHFPEADWIPNNIRVGIIRDITDSVSAIAGVVAQRETKEIQRGLWISKQLNTKGISRGIASINENSGEPSRFNETKMAQIPYIPVQELSRVLPHLPSGAVINLVRKNSTRKDVLISHQGLIIRNGNRILFRHANSNGVIRTEPLMRYLTRKHQAERDTWPVLGINVNQLNGASL